MKHNLSDMTQKDLEIRLQSPYVSDSDKSKCKIEIERRKERKNG